MHVGRAAIEAEDVGLERAEALLAHRAGEGAEVVERAHRRLAHRLGMAQAIGAAVRPVEPQPVAHRTVQELGDRHAQRPRLDVDQRVLERRDRLLDQPARRLAGERVQHRRDALYRPGIQPDQVLGEPADDRAQSLAAVALVVLGPADHAIVGGDLEERPDAPAGIAVQVLDFGNPHELSPSPVLTVDPRLHAGGPQAPDALRCNACKADRSYTALGRQPAQFPRQRAQRPASPKNSAAVITSARLRRAAPIRPGSDRACRGIRTAVARL